MILVILSVVVLLVGSRKLALSLVDSDEELAFLTIFLSTLVLGATITGYRELFFSLQFVNSWIFYSVMGVVFLVPKQKNKTITIKNDRWLLFCIGCIVFFSLYIAVSAPPRGYDALWFHLPLADHFQRTGSLLPPSSFRWFWHPANANLLFSALLSLTRDRWLNGTGAFFLALLSYLSVRLYQRLCASFKIIPKRFDAPCISLWLSTTPCFFFLSLLALTDLPCTAMATLAIYWFVRWHQTEKAWVYLILSGLSSGLAIGTKSVALPITAGLALLFAWGSLQGPIRHKTKRMILTLFIFLGAVFLTGGFWYLRNAILMGNPLHPLSLAVGPFRLGAEGMGELDPGKEALLLGGEGWWRWLFFPFVSTWYSHEWGLGVLPGALVVLGFFALPFIFCKRSTPLLMRSLFFLLLLHLIGWWSVSRLFRHLLLLWPLALSLLMFYLLQKRAGRFIALLWPLVAIYTIVDISLLTNRWEQSLESESDWHSYYGLPKDYEERMPKNSLVANLIGEPNNFPLAGVDGRFVVLGFNDARGLSAKELAARGVDYVVSLHRANMKLPVRQGFTLVSEWYLPASFRWWGFFRLEPAVGRLWVVGSVKR